VSAVSGVSALAQVAADAGPESQADLAQDLTNPVADLVTVPLQTNFDTVIGPVDDGSKWQANIQPVLPFNLNASVSVSRPVRIGRFPVTSRVCESAA
jgi:hypothetical protein